MNKTKQLTGKQRLGRILDKYSLELILVVMIVIMSFASSSFFTVKNLLNILGNMTLQGVIAFGMTMVIIAGEIDLSISSTVALSSVLVGMVAGKISEAGWMPMEYAVIVGMLVAILAGALVGFINGWLRTRFNIPSFIVTLAMMNVLYGVAAVITNGFPVTTLPSWYNFIGAGRLFGVVPVSALFLLVTLVVVLIVMNYTKFGRQVYAVGGNAEAARLSGINTKRVKIICMMAVQVCAAISGILVSSQVMSGSFTFGKGWEMTAISSVIIGGASLAGGAGTVKGTFVGLVFLGIIINGMTLLNVNDYAQYIVRGMLIILAVLLNTVRERQRNK